MIHVRSEVRREGGSEGGREGAREGRREGVKYGGRKGEREKNQGRRIRSCSFLLLASKQYSMTISTCTGCLCGTSVKLFGELMQCMSINLVSMFTPFTFCRTMVAPDVI